MQRQIDLLGEAEGRGGKGDGVGNRWGGAGGAEGRVRAEEEEGVGEGTCEGRVRA